MSPAVFGEQWQPEMRLDINTRVNTITDNRIEVLLRATTEAKVKEDGRVVYICEVVQAGVFVLEGGEPDQRHRALGTMCPNMLFPYVRETMDSLVVKGGFPVQTLAPVNFDAIYQQALMQKEQQADGGEVTH